MNLNKVFQFLVPKDNKFLSLFEKDAENLVLASIVLKQLIATDDIAERNVLNIKIKEHEDIGDDYTHTIFDELNRSFITPFDRDDIQRLTSSIDDVLDYIDSASQKIRLYKPKALLFEFRKMADLVLESTQQIELAIKELKNLKRPEKIKAICIKIHSIENSADDEYHNLLSSLFDNEKDAIELIKKKEIIQTLERAVDSAENVSDVIKTIIVKAA